MTDRWKYRIAVSAWLARMAKVCRKHLPERPQRRLRMCESLALGEKRMLAVVQFDQVRYLVGATASTVTLLSRLPDDGLGNQNATLTHETLPCAL